MGTSDSRPKYECPGQPVGSEGRERNSKHTADSARARSVVLSQEWSQNSPQISFLNAHWPRAGLDSHRVSRIKQDRE